MIAKLNLKLNADYEYDITENNTNECLIKDKSINTIYKVHIKRIQKNFIVIVELVIATKHHQEMVC